MHVTQRTACPGDRSWFAAPLGFPRSLGVGRWPCELLCGADLHHSGREGLAGIESDPWWDRGGRPDTVNANQAEKQQRRLKSC